MEVKMKRIKNIVAGFAALVLGISFAFADKAQYDKLLAEAKQYESQGKWCSALGTYWDAIGSNLGDAQEAEERYNSILEGFIVERELEYFRANDHKVEYIQASGYSGNPGPGQYDEFSRYDGWIELCKDFEIYWNEHPADILTSEFSIKKGDLDMKTRTATYDFSVNFSFSPKFDVISQVIIKGLYNRYDYKTWTDIPYAWPAVSMFKDSKTIPVVKFIDVQGYDKPDVGTWYASVNNLVDFSLIAKRGSLYFNPRNREGGFPHPFAKIFLPGRTTGYSVAAWNNLAAINRDGGSNLYVQFRIEDDSGKTIASSNKPVQVIVSNKFSYSGSEYSVKTITGTFSLSGISTSDIKKLDSGNWKGIIDSLTLTPRTVSAILKSDYVGEWDYFTNVKYKDAGSSIDFLNKGKTDFATVDVLNQNKKATEESDAAKNKASYVQIYFDSRKLNFDNSDGFKYRIKLDTKTLRCTRRDGKYVIVQNSENAPILGTVDDLLVHLNDMDSKDAKWKFNSNESGYVYRYLAESEVIQKKQEYLSQNKKADAEGKKAVYNDVFKWETNRNENHEKEIVLELFKYISALQEELHANINDLTLEEKKGVVTVKAVSGEFESKGLKKKDVITQMSLKEFDGITRTVTASELSKIPGQSTLIFTVQRGSGKKAQKLTIEVPVEWNGRFDENRYGWY